MRLRFTTLPKTLGKPPRAGACRYHDMETDATYQRNLLEFGKQIVTLAQPSGAEAADVRTLGLALVGAMTNVGAAWLLTGYRDPEETMVRNCRRVLLGTLQAMAPG